MGTSKSPRLPRGSRKRREDISNNNEVSGSTRDVHSAQELGSPRDYSPLSYTASPSPDGGSSSGLGTDNSFVYVDREDSSGGSSPSSEHLANSESNGSDQDTTDSEAERSRTSSQTSGVPPSPRHGSATGAKVLATFEFEECVVISHSSNHVTCPIDGDLPLKEAAPDVVGFKNCGSIQLRYVRTHGDLSCTIRILTQRCP